MCALGRRVERVDRLAARHEQAVSIPADETQVGRALGHHDLTDLRAIGRIDVDPVPAVPAESGSAPDVAIDVSTDAVMKAGGQRCELAPVGEPVSVVLDGPRDDP